MTMPSTALVGRRHDGTVSESDHDPAPRPRRRSFSAEYKAAILAEYESLTEEGARGALLRQEGLYSSHIVDWRRARDAGALEGLSPKARPSRRTKDQIEADRLRRENARLADELAKHRLALEIQGKASELLETLLAESRDDTRQQP